MRSPLVCYCRLDCLVTRPVLLLVQPDHLDRTIPAGTEFLPMLPHEMDRVKRVRA